MFGGDYSGQRFSAKAKKTGTFPAIVDRSEGGEYDYP